MHESCEAVGVRPAGHAVQLVAPLVEKLPAGQVTGVMAVEKHDFPGGHTVHCVLPRESAYVPTGHEVHVFCEPPL